MEFSTRLLLKKQGNDELLFQQNISPSYKSNIDYEFNMKNEALGISCQETPKGVIASSGYSILMLR